MCGGKSIDQIQDIQSRLKVTGSLDHLEIFQVHERDIQISITALEI